MTRWRGPAVAGVFLLVNAALLKIGNASDSRLLRFRFGWANGREGVMGLVGVGLIALGGAMWLLSQSF